MATALRSAHGMGPGSTAAASSHLLDRVFDTLSVWRQRAISRWELSTLDERMLRDIGISQLDAEHEMSKHFWQA